jgi:hypothetical protein
MPSLPTSEQIEAAHRVTRHLIGEHERAAHLGGLIRRQALRDHSRKWTWLYVILFAIAALLIGSSHCLDRPPGF